MGEGFSSPFPKMIVGMKIITTVWLNILRLWDIHTLNYCQLGVPLHLLQIPTMGADILKIMELHHLHQLIQHVVLVAVLEYVQVVAVKVENGEIQDIIPAVVANLGLPAQAVMVTSDALIAMEQEDVSLMSFTAQSVGCSFAL